MISSRFNLEAVDSPEKGKVAVYNTLTQALAVFDKAVWEVLEKGETQGLASDEAKALEDMGILVPDGLDEDLFFDVFYNQLRFDNSTLKITLLTTLNCNFACTYCYEGNLTYGKKQMSLETADAVLSWIKDRALERKVSEIRITYHGGEPLLNIPVIERVGSGLMGFCKYNDIKLHGHIISNGSLLTGETAERIARAGINSVKVTLDGPEEVHDSHRPLRGGAGTYKTIIKNLLEAKDIISVRIGGNFTKESASRIPALLDELIEVGLGPESVDKVRFTPVMPSEERKESASVFDAGCVPTEGFHEEFIRTQEEVVKRGFDTYLEPRINPCPVVNSSDFTVNHDGVIYKCPCLVDHPQYAVGNVGDDFTYNAEMAKCLGYNTFDNEKCRDCPVLPLCLGGCRYLSLIRKGNFHDIDCQKDTIEAIYLHAVRRMAKEEYEVA